MKDLKLNILMVIAMLTWGLSWTNAKIIGEYSDPPLIMLWRFFIASLSFIPILYFSKNNFKIHLSYLPHLLANSLFMVLYNFFYFKGTQIGLAGKGGVLVTTLNPILTALVVNLFFDGSFSRKGVSGLIMGLLGGSVILRIWELDITDLINSGNLYFLFASMSWVSVTIITSRTKDIIPFMTYSFWSFTIAFLFCIPLAYNQDTFTVFNFDWLFWINLSLLSIGAMSFGTSIYFYTSTELGAKRASSFILLVPFSAMIFAMFFLNEPLSATTFFGGLMGVTAIYLINKDL